jgi:hypothetical protein
VFVPETAVSWEIPLGKPRKMGSISLGAGASQLSGYRPDFRTDLRRKTFYIIGVWNVADHELLYIQY